MSDDVLKTIINQSPTILSVLIAGLLNAFMLLRNRAQSSQSHAENAAKLDAVAKSVDGKMDKLLAKTAEASNAEGMAAGIEQERHRPHDDVNP